ncbi:hypothetical protein [Mycobacterium sp. 852002-51971_SCH5477799-a]|uniref:hypothetical protein n=1 Tax=Mycobacterium sp. 852002-51971_SCH5477799-a TaxID=1834106 RepID=UPI0012E744AD|nr:hypothetical protein [Mycobacterium sp. 852002-51971_SCH5477799-a]
MPLLEINGADERNPLFGQLWCYLAREVHGSRIGLIGRQFQDGKWMSLHFRKAVGKTLMPTIAGVDILRNKWRPRALNHNGSSSSGTDHEHPPTR